jgi:hypothetical protein
LRVLEAQVRELQSSLLTLSRLVNERLLISGDVNKSPEADSSEEHLVNLLEEQRAVIKQMTEERKRFLQRIAQMTVGPTDLEDDEVSGAEDDKTRRGWRCLWPRGL